jgi:hypothetical protein
MAESAGPPVMGHVDLLGVLGELWCLTLAPGSVREVLTRMGIAEDGDLASLTFVELVEESELRVELASEDAGYPVALGARSVGAGAFTLVLQYDGSRDWVGVQEEVLSALSVDGRAASLFVGGSTEMWCAENGSVTVAADVGTWRCWGPEPRRFADLLPEPYRSAADLSQARPPHGDLLARCVQFTPFTLESFVGCSLAESDLNDPWSVGWLTLPD